ncbi:Uncharacterised protein [Bordetella pertussis]|nr:Uncharacterised protein [Bordetella pertussis]
MWPLRAIWISWLAMRVCSCARSTSSPEASAWVDQSFRRAGCGAGSGMPGGSSASAPGASPMMRDSASRWVCRSFCCRSSSATTRS